MKAKSHRPTDPVEVSLPLREQLLRLEQALKIVAGSSRSYFRDRSILPAPIKRNGRLLFLASEVQAHIEKLADGRGYNA